MENTVVVAFDDNSFFLDFDLFFDFDLESFFGKGFGSFIFSSRFILRIKIIK